MKFKLFIVFNLNVHNSVLKIKNNNLNFKQISIVDLSISLVVL